jgi:6-phosphogluconolactonase
MTKTPALHTFDDETAFLDSMTSAIEGFIEERLSSQRTVTLALSGEASLIPMYRKLSESRRIPWSRVILFLADERYAPLNSKESSFHRISEALADRVKNLRKFYSYNTKEPIETLVHWYDQTLRLQEKPLFDLAILGLGADGSIAGLFPSDSALHEKRRLVAQTRSLDQNGFESMTLTFPALLDSRKIMVAAKGQDKSEIVDQWVSGQAKLDELPAIGLSGHSDVGVFFDQSR